MSADPRHRLITSAVAGGAVRLEVLGLAQVDELLEVRLATFRLQPDRRPVLSPPSLAIAEAKAEFGLSTMPALRRTYGTALDVVLEQYERHFAYRWEYADRVFVPELDNAGVGHWMRTTRSAPTPIVRCADCGRWNYHLITCPRRFR